MPALTHANPAPDTDGPISALWAEITVPGACRPSI